MITNPFSMMFGIEPKNFIDRQETKNKIISEFSSDSLSSKSCSDCGYINSKLELNDRVLVCPICGKKHDRDVKAAINIKKEGIRLILQTSSDIPPNRRNYGDNLLILSQKGF